MANEQERLLSSTDEINCIFCKIVRGEAPASIIVNRHRVLAIMSLGGHPLILPKIHVRGLSDPNLDQDTYTELSLAEYNIARVIEKVYSTREYNTFSAVGRGAGQEVEHYHKHIIPRYPEDRLIRIRREDIVARETLDETAEKLNYFLRQLR